MSILKMHTGGNQAAVRLCVERDLVAEVARTGCIPEYISCADEPGRLADAVRSPGLFVAQRLLAVDLDGLSESEAQLVAEGLTASDAVIVAHATDVPAAILKRLTPFATITKHPLPSNRDAGTAIDELAGLLGIILSGASRTTLVNRLGHDLDRVSSVLRGLAIGGYREPNSRQIEMMAGTSTAAGVPWDVTDALDRRDLAAALEASRRCEAVPLVAYLTKCAIEAARCAENPGADAAELLGVSNWAAQKANKLSRQMGRTQLATLIVELVEADRRVKLAGNRSGEVVDEVLHRWLEFVGTR